SQLAPDLVHLLLAVFVVHYGRARDNSQALRIEASKLRDHLLRQAVAEVVLRGACTNVFEGKNRQHQSSSRGRNIGSETRPSVHTQGRQQHKGNSKKDRPSPHTRDLQRLIMRGIQVGWILYRWAGG